MLILNILKNNIISLVMVGEFMKKLFISFLIMFLISGCASKNITTNTVYYNLNISDVYSEKIIFSISKDDYEEILKYSSTDATYVPAKYILLNTDINTITTSSNEFYRKEIKKQDDKVSLSLIYDYLENNFLNERYIDQCFENYNLNSADDYFEISLSGKYYCINEFDNLIINVTNNNYVIDTNGTKTNNGYTWTIDKDNASNVDIYYKFSRYYGNMATKIENKNNKFKRFFSIVTLVLLVIICFGLFTFYKKYKYFGME